MAPPRKKMDGVDEPSQLLGWLEASYESLRERLESIQATCNNSVTKEDFEAHVQRELEMHEAVRKTLAVHAAALEDFNLSRARLGGAFAVVTVVAIGLIELLRIAAQKLGWL